MSKSKSRQKLQNKASGSEENTHNHIQWKPSEKLKESCTFLIIIQAFMLRGLKIFKVGKCFIQLKSILD